MLIIIFNCNSTNLLIILVLQTSKLASKLYLMFIISKYKYSPFKTVAQVLNVCKTTHRNQLPSILRSFPNLHCSSSCGSRGYANLILHGKMNQISNDGVVQHMQNKRLEKVHSTVCLFCSLFVYFSLFLIFSQGFKSLMQTQA